LNAGFDLRAADRGCFVVRTVSDVLPDYIATVLAALPRWLENESAARPFLLPGIVTHPPATSFLSSCRDYGFRAATGAPYATDGWRSRSERSFRWFRRE